MTGTSQYILPLDEPLKTPELHDMEARLFDLAGLVEPNGNLAVAFDPRDRIDDDLARSLTDLDVAHGVCRFMMISIRTCTTRTVVPASYRSARP